MKDSVSILVESHDGLARVTLNRPQQRNALDASMIDKLREAFDEFAQDPSVRAVVLGSSGPAFCAGADLNSMGSEGAISASDAQKYAERLMQMFRAIDECPCPVIGRIQGAAFGGGVGLIAVCDIAVVVEDVTFTMSEVRWGLIPAVIAPFLLRKTGESFVRRYCLTGEPFSASAAKQFHLVHDVIEQDKLDARVEELVQMILRLAPQATRDTKALFRRLLTLSEDERRTACIEANAYARASAEAQEGLRAFLEKRFPVWTEGKRGKEPQKGSLTMLQGNRHKPTRPIRIIEVGPRDGLQNEPGIVSTEDKVSFVNALSRTGVAEIEIGSFVSPHAIPQLSDSDEVFRKIDRLPGVTYSALVPNKRGLERARAVEIQKIAVFTAASETFTQHNIKCGVRESIDQFAPVVDEAHRNGMTVRAYISTATHCPFEGPVNPSRVSEVMHRLLQIGVDEISLGDTIGKATPSDVRRLLDEILPHIERSRLSLHFHDTYGMAVANVLTAWTDYDIEAFDTAAGGLGGCPYAPGASGNVATEDAVFALKASGASVPVDEQRVIAAALEIRKVLNHPLSSRLSRIQIEQTAHERVP